MVFGQSWRSWAIMERMEHSNLILSALSFPSGSGQNGTWGETCFYSQLFSSLSSSLTFSYSSSNLFLPINHLQGLSIVGSQRKPVTNWKLELLQVKEPKVGRILPRSSIFLKVGWAQPPPTWGINSPVWSSLCLGSYDLWKFLEAYCVVVQSTVGRKWERT